MTRFSRQFRKVGRSLSRVELMRSSMDATFALTDVDLLDKNAGRRFLDYYGDEGLRLAFERYGFYDAVRALGYDDFELETWAHDERHTLLIGGRTPGSAACERLLELTVRRDRLCIDPVESYGKLDRTWEVLTVDWLTLRHPRGAFAQDRLRLPGQEVPGLGVGERVLELLYRVVDRLRLDGLVTVPEHFHNATLYARELPFVDPWYAGQLHALEHLLFEKEKLQFAQAAWAVHWGHVLDENDRAFAWRGEAMAYPHDDELAGYLKSDAYQEAARKSERNLHYRVHRAAFDDQWARDYDALLVNLDRA